MTDTARDMSFAKPRRPMAIPSAFLCIILLVALISRNVEAFVPHTATYRIGSTTTSSVVVARSSVARSRWIISKRSQNDDEDGILEKGRTEDLQLSPSPDDADSIGRRNLVINAVAVGLFGVSGIASYSLFQTSVYTPPGFRRLPRTQFIAALGDPQASQGTEAKSWGLWMQDPGPRGVWLKDYNKEIVQQDNHAPAGWTYDPDSWWLEEHGLIMEAPQFPLKEGRYLVTGGRLVTTGLTIDRDGRWKLDEGTLYDVTHLPCRSARYQPQESAGSNNLGSPLAANPRDFPVIPGATMPEVKGCNKQDYAVLFVVGKAEQT